MSTTDDEIEIRIMIPDDFVVVQTPTAIDLTILASRDYEQLEAEVLRLTNVRRQTHGVHPVKPNEFLARSALAHTLDMAENHFISHTGSGNTDLEKRINRAGYVAWTAIGENLAMGYRSAAEVVEAWMTSPGHCKNLLSPIFYEIGIAFIEGDIVQPDGRVWRGGYWTQNFGARMTFEHVLGHVVSGIKHTDLHTYQSDDDIVIRILDG